MDVGGVEGECVEDEEEEDGVSGVVGVVARAWLKTDLKPV